MLLPYTRLDCVEGNIKNAELERVGLNKDCDVRDYLRRNEVMA